MAAVITPAVEGMGGNFLLFYPAIPMGVGHSLPHLLLLVVECEPKCSHPMTGARRMTGSHSATVRRHLGRQGRQQARQTSVSLTVGAKDEWLRGRLSVWCIKYLTG